VSVLLDSSLLVPVVVAKHPDHAQARAWYQQQAARTEMLATTHALAEVFNVVSGFYRVPHAECRHLLTRLRRELGLVSLSQADYMAAIELTMQVGRSGPTVYDALHVAGFQKSGATHLVYCDERSFPSLLPSSTLVNPLVR
jgi:predicted nucleic acid-binding protein